MNYIDFINGELQEAAVVARQFFGQVAGTVKAGDNNQILTEADVAIGRQLVASVRRDFPQHNVIDEEAGVIDNHSEFTWVIDPIDGTSNFAAGLAEYGIMMGLLQGDEPIAGGLALPAFNEIYVAAKGEGAWCNGERVHVSGETALSNALVSYGIDGHQEDPERTRSEAAKLGEIVLGIRNLRSSNSVYDLAMVARGRYGANLNRTSKIWDNVAPQMVVTEAGGVWTRFDGAPVDYRDPLRRVDENFTVCCGSLELHRQLQEIIHG